MILAQLDLRPIYWIRRFFAVAVYSLAFSLPNPVAAQLSGGLNAGAATRYTWRGIVVGSRATVQPSAWASVRWHRVGLSGGGWLGLEPFSPRSADFSVAKGGDHGLAESNIWLQLGLRSSVVELAVGGVRYSYFGESEEGGIDSVSDRNEAYLLISPFPGATPVDLLIAGYANNEAADYVEVVASHSLPVLPKWPGLLPFGDILLEATLGSYFNNNRADSASSRLTYAGGDGVSHFDLAATTSVNLNSRIYLHATAHHQWNTDDRTRQTTVTTSEGTRWWFEGGLTLQFGKS
jgi:hypothetical protein